MEMPFKDGVKLPFVPVIESLRGIASLMVCIFHIVYSTEGFVTDLLFWKPFFYYFSYGVQIFFVISGVVIPLSLWNLGYNGSQWKSFLIRRFIRLEPPYLVSVLLTTLYFLLRNVVPGAGETSLIPSLGNFFLHIGYLVPFVEGSQWIQMSYWTLGVELQYYLAMSILFLLLFHPQLWRRIAAYAFMFGTAFLIRNEFFVFASFPIFLLGILYIQQRTGIITQTERYLVSLLSVLAIYAIFTPQYCAFSVLTILVIEYFPAFSTQITRFLGKISYSLYLTHTITGAALLHLLLKFLHLQTLKPLTALLSIGFALLIAYFYAKWIEQPFQRISRRGSLK